MTVMKIFIEPIKLEIDASSRENSSVPYFFRKILGPSLKFLKDLPSIPYKPSLIKDTLCNIYYWTSIECRLQIMAEIEKG